MKLSKILVFVFCSFLLVNCANKKTKKEIKVTDKVPASFQMYKTSEMAELMRTMLAKNKKLRAKIIEGKDIGDFNDEYLKIHTAKLTDSTDLDATFPTFANHFVKMQKDVFSVESSKQKEQFNSMINACVACHKDRCSGPIPRIKKLIIQ